MRTEKIKTIRELMQKALELRKITGEPAKLIIEDFLGAQMEEKFTHGLGKFLLIDSALKERKGSPKIVKEGTNYALVNGNKELGHIAAHFSINKLKEKAKNGIGTVGLYNSSRYGRLKIFGQMLSDSGLVGLIMNNAGPGAVTPFNGIDPILGTNPICFSFPSFSNDFIFDFSTSKEVWGEIRQAMLEQRELPSNSFLNKNGEFTLNPNDADAVLPFDGPKGYAICLAIELLAGALVGAEMGLNVKNQYDLGFLFIAIDANIFTPLNLFKNKIKKLSNEITSSRPQKSIEKVRLPGERSFLLQKQAERNGIVKVDSETFNRLKQMSESLGGGLQSNDKVD